MTTAVDIDPVAWSAIDSWPAALVVALLILALLVWPGILAWLNTRRVRQTLTTNNGGSHVKDSLDRIEATQANHGARLAALEQAAERRGGLSWRRRPRC